MAYVDAHNAEGLTIGISPTKMAAKNYKANKLNEIEAATCALLNSGGGKLKLFLESDNNNFNASHQKMIEQRLSNVLRITIKTKHIKIYGNQQEITIDVKEAIELITVKSNLYLPMESQVVEVKVTEPTQDIKRILQQKIVEDPVSIGSHVKNFVKGESSGLQESNDVQFKNLKADPSKCVRLADRMVGKSNKFKSYISAFANHHGGHIYYGIADDGIAEGEKVATEKEKDEITKKTTNTINKMIWPFYDSKPQRGEHWDIFFEPVKDTAGNQLLSLYVIVISIAPCPGGVFTEEPESYYVVEGKVKKMDFHEWQSNLFGLSLPSSIPRVTWSSQGNRSMFRELSEKLTKQRNNESINQFKKLCAQVRANVEWCRTMLNNAEQCRTMLNNAEQCRTMLNNVEPCRTMLNNAEQCRTMLNNAEQCRTMLNNVELIILAEEVVAAYKINDFPQAESLLENFAKILPGCDDSPIFEVRMLQLKSMIERTKGNYKDSYSLTHQGLQTMEQTPLELQTAWFYIDASVDATYISVNERCMEEILSNKDKALKYLELAARAAKRLGGNMPSSPDLLQKIHIHKIWALLGCGMNGEVVEQFTPSCKDLKAATEELTSVHESSLMKELTHFRKVQYHLAECDVHRRRSDFLEKDPIPNLEQAMECASRARDLAKKHKFDMMVDYSIKRLDDIKRKRDTANSPTERTFLGFEY